MPTDREQLIEAFKAGARWCATNGADFWVELDYDAAFYADTGIERERDARRAGGLKVRSEQALAARGNR
jgi:hypothetical protein